MIGKVLFVLGILSASIFGQENWTGYKDTSAVTGLCSTGTVRSKVFELSKYEHTTVLVLFDDTSETGFASDSVAFVYGYELGIPVLSTAGLRDTAWSPIVYVDSVSVLGLMTASQQDSTLTTVKSRGWSDTTNVSGWGYTFSQIVPEGGAPLIRYVATGLAGNKGEADVALIFQNVRRLGTSNVTR
jgi:hypothetical protein